MKNLSHNETYYFYLARCSDRSLYSGIAKNLKEREQKHNAGKGAKYTKSRRPVKVVYAEECDTKGVALRREAEVKKWSRAKKQLLISGKLKK